jgi:hypothetical protein
MGLITAGWCRVALAAVVMLPVLLLVLLSAPAWLAVPLLPESHGRRVAAHLAEIGKWHVASVRCLIGGGAGRRS